MDQLMAFGFNVSINFMYEQFCHIRGSPVVRPKAAPVAHNLED
jgi:hypothetical protein